MLPLRDDNPTRRFAWVTLIIIAVNVVAFLVWEPTFATGPDAQERQSTFFFCHAQIAWETTHQTSLEDGGEAAQQAIGRSGILSSRSSAARFQRFLRDRCPHKSWVASIFTAMFLHVSWLHIGGNMLFLWILGNNVEDRLRPVRYVLFYLASGIGSLSQDVNTGGVAFWAHIGGFAFGALMALASFPKEGFGRPAPRRPDLPLGTGYGWGRRRRPPAPG